MTLEPLPDPVLSQCHVAVLHDSIYLTTTIRKGGRKQIQLYSSPTDIISWKSVDVMQPPEATMPISLIADSEHSRLLMITLQVEGQQDSVWAYTKEDSSWRVVTTCSFPEARRDCTYSLLTSHNLLVAAGGKYCMNNESSHDVTAFNMKTSEWSRWPALRTMSRSQGHLLTLGSSLLLVGGYHPRTYAPVTKVTSIELHKAETQSGRWRTHSASSCSGTCGAISTQHHLVTCGGLNPDKEPHANTSIWSAGLRQWGELPSLSVPRAVPGMVQIGDKILCIGGCLAPRKYSNIVEQLVVSCEEDV